MTIQKVSQSLRVTLSMRMIKKVEVKMNQVATLEVQIPFLDLFQIEKIVITHHKKKNRTQIATQTGLAHQSQ